MVHSTAWLYAKGISFASPTYTHTHTHVYTQTHTHTYVRTYTGTNTTYFSAGKPLNVFLDELNPVRLQIDEHSVGSWKCTFWWDEFSQSNRPSHIQIPNSVPIIRPTPPP